MTVTEWLINDIIEYIWQVITINGKFPGPLINATTNDFVHVNVFNNLDEPLLFTWCDLIIKHILFSSARMSIENAR